MASNIAKVSSVMMSIKEELLSAIHAGDLLIRLDEQETKKLLDIADEGTIDERKELVKKVIRSTLNLSEKDVVIFRDDKITIRRFQCKQFIDDETLSKIDELAGMIRDAGIQPQGESDTPLIVSDSITVELGELLGEEVEGSICNNLKLRNALKERIRQEIGLDERDAILFINNKVVIRKFKSAEQKKADDKLRYEQRYNGLPKEELEQMRSEMFEDEEQEREIVNEIMQELFKTELDFTQINNAYFLKTYVKTLQKAFAAALKPFLPDEDDIVVEGLGNLLLREYWMLCHYLMAEKLAQLTADRDANVTVFLKYYSGDTEVDENRIKYQRPEIIDEDGMKWNAVSILGLAMQQKKLMETYTKKQQAVATIEKSIEELRASAKTINEENANFEKEMAATENEIAERGKYEKEANERTKQIKELLKTADGEAKSKLQAEMSEIALTLKKLMIKEEAHFSRKKRLEASNKLSSTKLQKIDFEITKLKRRIQEENERTEQFFKQQGQGDKYEKMLNALAMALTKRKVQIG